MIAQSNEIELYSILSLNSSIAHEPNDNTEKINLFPIFDFEPASHLMLLNCTEGDDLRPRQTGR